MDYGAAGRLFVTLDGMDDVHADHSPPKKKGCAHSQLPAADTKNFDILRLRELFRLCFDF